MDEALDLDSGVHVFAVNLYPPCPQPDLAIGVPPHVVGSMQASKDHSCVVVWNKLTTTNYSKWKSHMLSMIESQDLEGFINGERKHPAREICSTDGKGRIHNPNFDKWQKTDRLVKQWIISTLSKEVIYLVEGLDSSYDVWNAIAARLGPVPDSHPPDDSHPPKSADTSNEVRFEEIKTTRKRKSKKKKSKPVEGKDQGEYAAEKITKESSMSLWAIARLLHEHETFPMDFCHPL
ncbi:hypothetical protein RJ639_016870 [Escallonia herrerae]|uniref:Retrotransposon Copia-like N-terminal domain-containing protein n=1 Tax=Escallonia herrerae TaxID=1293975 RepID=A0AA89AMV6_9ASTE|nr:hypothetical protein RJ639_016870 [Escallonia herrerae]